MDLIVHYAFDCTTNVWFNHLNFQLMRLKLCNAHLHRTQNTKAELSRSLAHLPSLKLAHLCDSNFNRFTKIITKLDTISKTLNRKNWVHFGVVCVMCIDYRIEACACAVYFCNVIRLLTECFVAVVAVLSWSSPPLSRQMIQAMKYVTVQMKSTQISALHLHTCIAMHSAFHVQCSYFKLLRLL